MVCAHHRQSSADAGGSSATRQLDSAEYVNVESPALANGNLTSGVSADFNSVSPRYLEAMGVRLLQGRLISENDTEATPKVAVIDEMLARALWPDQSPMGKLINTGETATPVWRQVVGVVAVA